MIFNDGHERRPSRGPIRDSWNQNCGPIEDILTG